MSRVFALPLTTATITKALGRAWEQRKELKITYNEMSALVLWHWKVARPRSCCVCLQFGGNVFIPKNHNLKMPFKPSLFFPYQNYLHRLEGGLEIISINPLILQRGTEAQGSIQICQKSHPSHVFSLVLQQCLLGSALALYQLPAKFNFPLILLSTDLSWHAPLPKGALSICKVSTAHWAMRGTGKLTPVATMLRGSLTEGSL